MKAKQRPDNSPLSSQPLPSITAVRKRKRQQPQEGVLVPESIPSAITKDCSSGLPPNVPFSSFKRSFCRRPTPEECEYAVSELSKIHPEVLEKTHSIRTVNSHSSGPDNIEILKHEDGADQPLHSACGSQPTILDGVVSTMLSQNTTAANSTRAFSNLKKSCPDWNQVAKLTTPTKVETAIRCAGMSKKRALNMWNICKSLVEERGEASFEYLRHKSNLEIQQELLKFKGLGKKTISCVLLFTLGRCDEFPVDTHVHRISKQHHWIPSSFSREDAYEYLNSMVPSHLKLNLHCLLVQHGRECHRCAARGKPQFPPKDGSKLACPLVHLNDIVSRNAVALQKTEKIST
jgi:endonuclease-3